MWTAAILAGGQARRLGGVTKARLTLGETRILDRQIDRLSRVADRIVIVAADSAPFAALGIPIIPDVAPGGGALGALHTAVSESNSDRTLVVACDMPFLTDAWLRFLVEAGTTADIAIPRTARGYEPLCATYSRRTARGLQQMIEERRFRLSDVARIPDVSIREIGSIELARFGAEDVLFLNVNTPEDYARAVELNSNFDA